MKNRLLHRGISDFALWVLVQTKGEAILAGKKVKVLEAEPSMTQGEGWYNVQVQDVETNETSWMDVTTAEYQQKIQDRINWQKQWKADRKKRQLPDNFVNHA